MALYGRTRGTRVLVVGLVAVSLFTITLDFRGGSSGPLDAAGRAMLSVVAPLQEAVSRVFRPIGDFFSGLTQVGRLREENAVLRDQLAQLGTTADRLERILEENRALGELLELQDTLNLRTTGARVISRGTSNFEWTVTIDKGTSDGVQVNMPVMTADGLVGKVVIATSGASTVQLITDPQVSVGVRLVKSGEIGIMEGQRGQDLRLSFYDATNDVRVQELVETSGSPVTAGASPIYPPGIPVGVVSAIDRDPAATSHEVRIRPHVDFTRLDVVAVVLGPES